MKNVVILTAALGLGGCAGQGPGFLDNFRGMRGYDRPRVDTAPPPAQAPVARPPDGADTAEEFDTTTPEQRTAALVPPAIEGAGDGLLGTTIASLGDPAEAGFWIRTPLVTEPASGRVVYAVSGRTVQVQLIPSGGAAGSGSQVSLAAMRLLDAPLTELPELVVYKN